MIRSVSKTRSSSYEGIVDNTFRSFFNKLVADFFVRGNFNPSLLQFLVWHRWPYPTVGKPTGSGAGFGTKPSNSLMRSTVAPLTLGPVHALSSIGEARMEEGRTERAPIMMFEKRMFAN